MVENKGEVYGACISIHSHLTLTPGKWMPRDWAFCLSRFKDKTLSHRFILNSHPFSQVLRHRNGHWKWLDAVHQISCLSYCWIFSVPRKTLNPKKCTSDNESPTNTRYKPLNTTEGSSSPQIPLYCVCVYLPTNEKPYLVAASVVSEEYVITAFSRPEREGYIMPCFGSFQRKCLPSFSVCSFVCSFFYLPYCSYKTYRWVDECNCAVTTYLPALVWICCFYVRGGKRETAGTETLA